jgi:hypothetical protein
MTVGVIIKWFIVMLSLAIIVFICSSIISHVVQTQNKVRENDISASINFIENGVNPNFVEIYRRKGQYLIIERNTIIFFSPRRFAIVDENQSDETIEYTIYELIE